MAECLVGCPELIYRSLPPAKEYRPGDRYMPTECQSDYTEVLRENKTVEALEKNERLWRKPVTFPRRAEQRVKSFHGAKACSQLEADVAARCLTCRTPRG